MMREAKIFNHNIYAGKLIKEDDDSFTFSYDKDYHGKSISLTMPKELHTFHYDQFPPFFDGLLPEGVLLEALLKLTKLDRDDYFSQLITVGHDLVGSVTVEAE